jgi:hypothetical protein
VVAGSDEADEDDGRAERRRAVPNGMYVLVLSVLRALGDPNNPAHTERWTLPPITLAPPQSSDNDGQSGRGD